MYVYIYIYTCIYVYIYIYQPLNIPTEPWMNHVLVLHPKAPALAANPRENPSQVKALERTEA